MTTDLLPSPPPKLRAVDAVAIAGLIVGVLYIYLRTARYGFINYDDSGYLYQNSHIRAGLSLANLAWAARAVVLANYHPLTQLVWLTLSTLFGMRPGAFHLTSVALHAANTGLLYLFLRQTTGRFWPPVLATALWAWHPLRVESVAWASELKDVLCGTLALVTLLAYARHVRRGRRPGGLVWVGVLIALAMLAKPMAITLPAVLLLLDYWPLGDGRDRPIRWWATRVLEKVPLAVVPLVVIAYTVAIQTRNLPAAGRALFTPQVRLANAAASVLAYVRQTLWPTGLAIFYPHPALLGRPVPWAPVVAGVAVLAIVTTVAVLARRRMPYVLVGWLWFLVMLVPVVGLIQVGEQARADRYTYLPGIGLTVALVWAVAAVRPPAAARVAGGIGVAAAVAALAVAVVTTRHWRSLTDVFAHAAAVAPDNYAAMLVLSDAARADGDADRAVALAYAAVGLTGDRTDAAWVTLGFSLLATGRDADVRPAVEAFVHATHLVPLDPAAWLGFGRGLSRQADLDAAQGGRALVPRRVDAAVDAYRRAIALDPDNAQAADFLAVLLSDHGRGPEAMDVWQRLFERFPDDPVAHGDAGFALQQAGHLDAAADQYRTAVRDGDVRPATRSRLAYLTAVDARSTPQDLAFVAPLAASACADPVAGLQPFPWYADSIVLARQARFDDAIAAGQRALALARSTGQTGMAAAIERRLDAYRQGFPAAPPRP